MYQSSEVDNDTLYVGRSSDGVGYSLVAAFPRYAGVAGWYMKTVALETFESDTLYTVFYAHGGSVGSCNIYMDSLYIWQPLTYTAADAARDEEKSVWSQACAGDEVKGYAEYLRLYPTGLYVDSARTMAGRARCVPLAAEIDTICRIVEGFDCGLHTSSPLLLMQLRGTTVASSDERNFAHEQFDWYSRHVAMYNGMGRSGRFRATCDVLDASAKDISLVAGVCMEFIDYAQLVNYTPDQFSSVWKRMFPGGQDALLKNVEKPLKGELEQVGLSGSLAQGIWDAVRASCWSRELRMNKTFLPQRDSLYPLILDELQKSHRVGE
jgi:hypothetical protein